MDFRGRIFVGEAVADVETVSSAPKLGSSSSSSLGVRGVDGVVPVSASIIAVAVKEDWTASWKDSFKAGFPEEAGATKEEEGSTIDGGSTTKKRTFLGEGA